MWIKAMTSIKIGTTGRIRKGDDVGSFVKILDDASNTGGYLIIISADKNFNEGYDDWVENKASLEKYFLESNWEIDWM
jgi:hypothetical protein